jgi:rifampicin phosphotransferase
MGGTTITWEAPAGGRWELETVHVRGAQPRLFQELAPDAFREGFRVAGERYGLPIDHLQLAFVNDHCYARMKPLGAPDPKPGRAASTPPAWAMWLLARLHPALRRRARAARDALAEQRWHEDLERWETDQHEEMLRTGRSLQAEPIEELDDEGLLDHLDRVAAHFSHGARIHFELVPLHNVPVGRLLLAGRAWGLADGPLLSLLAGSSPASAGSAAALATIADACAAAGVPEPRHLDEVRAASPAAAAALDAYLADHAWRAVTEYTPRGKALIELPHVLVAAIRAAGRAARRDQPEAAEPDPEPLRAQVPVAERARFDALLADARRCYGNRDENVSLTFLWPAGLLRRALLEAGRRLAARGIVAHPEEAFVLGAAELAGALRGERDLAAVVAERVQRAAAAEAQGAPLYLGEPEGDPPPSSVFPAAMGEVTDAVLVVFELEGLPHVGGLEDWTGSGVGIGDRPYVGRACVAASPEEALDALADGAVLVTSLTTPAYEALLPIVGAVVTEQGGYVSHTALVAREHGIPAVVGVAGATSAIPHGATVEVDPAGGAVRVVATSASGPSPTTRR